MLGVLTSGDSIALADRLSTLVENPAKQILDRSIQLRLTESQMNQLTVLADSFRDRLGVIAADLERQLRELGQAPAQARVVGLIRPVLESGQRLRREALEAAQRILTAEQWAALPGALTQPPAAPFGGGGRGAGGAARRPGGS